MKYVFFPVRYTESDNYDKLEGNFVRIGFGTKFWGGNVQWKFQEVRKVYPCVYELVGQAFWDFKDMYNKAK